MGRSIPYLFRAFLLLMAIVALSCCATLAEPDSSEPPSMEVEARPTEPPSGPTPGPTPTPQTPQVQVEERVAEVEWPASMRVGDSDVIRFSLIPSPEGGYVAEPEIEGHEVEPEPIPVPVVRPGYTGYAVTALSAAGLEVERASPDEQPLVPGQPNTWRWTISPDEAGTYRVVVALTVRWDPDPGTDLPGPFEEAVWSRILTVEARTTLGLSGAHADWLGLGGSALGGVASLPFAERVLATVWRRVKRSHRSLADRVHKIDQ